MRSLTLLALAALLASGCGDREPEVDTDSPRPSPAQPVDTTIGDTVSVQPDTAGIRPAGGAASGDPAAAPADRPGAAVGSTRRTRLYTVQVAAFERAASATEWVDRLQRQGLPVWKSVAEVRGRTFHRVRVGATPSFGEARTLGSMLTDRYHWPVWVAPATPADPMPDDVLAETRRVLSGD